MNRHRTPSRGDGTTWLVADRQSGGFHCYWYTGRAGDHLAESSSAATASEAVAWGRSRTPRVRIRTADGCSRWAGSAPRPDGIVLTWNDAGEAADPPTGGQP